MGAALPSGADCSEGPQSLQRCSHCRAAVTAIAVKGCKHGVSESQGAVRVL